MRWIKKKFRTWLRVDRLVKNEIEKQCKVLARSVSNGSYPWGEESKTIASALNGLVTNHIEKLSDREVTKQVNKIVAELKINKEAFLDEVVIRLKAKQV